MSDRKDIECKQEKLSRPISRCMCMHFICCTKRERFSLCYYLYISIQFFFCLLRSMFARVYVRECLCLCMEYGTFIEPIVNVYTIQKWHSSFRWVSSSSLCLISLPFDSSLLSSSCLLIAHDNNSNNNTAPRDTINQRFQKAKQQNKKKTTHTPMQWQSQSLSI